jgi:hypothetical protein
MIKTPIRTSIRLTIGIRKTDTNTGITHPPRFMAIIVRRSISTGGITYLKPKKSTIPRDIIGSCDLTSMIGMFTWLPISDRNKRRTEYSGGKPSFVKARPIRSMVIRKKTNTSINNNRNIKDVVILW